MHILRMEEFKEEMPDLLQNDTSPMIIVHMYLAGYFIRYPKY